MKRPVIIIFGAALWAGGVPSRTMQVRVQAALRLGATLDDPLYVPTGGIGRHGPSEASVMARLLVAAGVQPGAILLEETALDTTDSVFACRDLLTGEQGPVFAATSIYHLPRCVMSLRLAGVPARACPPPLWNEPILVKAWRAGREAIALPVDAAMVLWRRVRS